MGSVVNPSSDLLNDLLTPSTLETIAFTMYKTGD